MERALALLARWLGRALVLFAPYVLVCAFFLPEGVQFLNGVACPPTLELANARYTPPGQPDNERLELVCTSPEASQSAAQPILLIAAGSLAAGLALVYVAERRLAPRARIPGGPPVT